MVLAKKPKHDAPGFPLSRERQFGGGVGNAALNAWKVVVPAAAHRVRVLDWSSPFRVDTPIVARVNVQTWAPGDNPGGLGAACFQVLRGRLEYAVGQQKVVEDIGIPATGLLLRGSFREVTLDVWRDEDSTNVADGPTNLIASITHDDYTPTRWRQEALYIEAETTVPVLQRLPLGVSRYRASVRPWGTISYVEFYDSDGNLLLDVVPALSVDSWQALPAAFANWKQDEPTMQLPTSARVTLELE